MKSKTLAVALIAVNMVIMSLSTKNVVYLVFNAILIVVIYVVVTLISKRFAEG
ncbi:MAG: hypothetical protein TQ35_0000600 [Candidatus Aramenus sulfurataquae]|uniref:Uncharacterized protein n=2 Tax=Candidatus Aramenus sulfurataquae TaxID=1326980 RepID=A0AAE3FJV1_9CREN|nr:hypothetical protein [Candidatus Aramenus sp.]MCL7343288.1 hypothetical protein [Candidatus Aramenus sulfurataquae]